MNINKLDELIEHRLAYITAFAESISEEQAKLVSQLSYLKNLKETDCLEIIYNPKENPRMLPGDSGRFEIYGSRGQEKRLRLSQSFRGQWIDMADFLNLSDDDLSRAIDNFIIHELFHLGQNLTTDRHGDIRNAPAVLRAADYAADANAALTAFLMYAIKEGFSSSNWTVEYAKTVKSVLHQIYVFNFPEIRGDAILSSRLYRYFTWHYQFHRARSFNITANIRDFQIMYEPAIAIKDIRQGVTVTRDWGRDNFSNQPRLWLTAPNNFGVGCIYRYSALADNIYIALFEGVFDCSVDKTESFFRGLFEQHEELIGYEKNVSSTVKNNGVNSFVTNVIDYWKINISVQSHPIVTASDE